MSTEDKVTIELDRQVKFGFMERVKIGNEYGYKFSKTGKTIMDKIVSCQELNEDEKKMLKDAGMNLESLIRHSKQQKLGDEK